MTTEHRHRRTSSREPSDNVSPDTGANPAQLQPLHHQVPTLKQLYNTSLDSFSKLPRDQLERAFETYTQSPWSYPPTSASGNLEIPAARLKPLIEINPEFIKKLQSYVSPFVCRISNSLANSAQSSAFFDVNYTRKEHLRQIIPIMKLVRYCHPQRTIFFKLMFSGRLTLWDIQDTPIEFLSILAYPLSMLYRKPVDFSSHDAIIRTCDELSRTIRCHHKPESNINYLFGRFFGEMLARSDLDGEKFLQFLYFRYFQPGFQLDEFNDFFQLKIVQKDAYFDQNSKGSRCLKFRVKKINTDLFQRLGLCRRLVTEFSAFADCELDRLLVEDIRDNYLLVLSNIFNFLGKTSEYYSRVYNIVNEKCPSEVARFKWSIFEQQHAVQWLLQSIPKTGHEAKRILPQSADLDSKNN